MTRHTTTTPAQTEELGSALAKRLRGGALVAFTGPMGAGKTTFCRGMARGFACTDAASSPTFALVNVYRGPVLFAHFDAWRVTSPEDLETAGLFDYLEQGAVVAVEWSERVAGWLPEPDVRVDFEMREGMGRVITIGEATL